MLKSTVFLKVNIKHFLERNISYKSSNHFRTSSLFLKDTATFKEKIKKSFNKIHHLCQKTNFLDHPSSHYSSLHPGRLHSKGKHSNLHLKRSVESVILNILDIYNQSTFPFASLFIFFYTPVK